MPRLLLVAALICIPGFALGWSDAGHRIVALIAFEKLDDDTREKVLDILREHPRYAQDFDFPEDLPSQRVVREKWLFSQAAVWPDEIRGTDWDRPTWHYINLPYFLADEFDVDVNLAEQLPEGADLETQELNVIQTIALCRRILENSESSDADKAVAICWLFHLVGDIHQPCHSTALFLQNLFPNGDKGGNSIPLRRGRKLHSLWDGLLGSRVRFNTVQRRAFEILDDDEYMEAAAAAVDNLEAMAWTRESHDLAKQVAYHPLIVEAVRQADEDDADLDAIALPGAYYTEIGDVARRRVAEAGFRLARVLAVSRGD